jgi:hypothetical protein
MVGIVVTTSPIYGIAEHMVSEPSDNFSEARGRKKTDSYLQSIQKRGFSSIILEKQEWISPGTR